jgi:galactonate dehydratase
LCEVLEPYDLGFVEEPVMYEQPSWTRTVASRSRIPIAAGERAGAHHSSALVLAESGVSFFQPDVMICGGVTVAAKICAVAESLGVSIAFHNPFGPLQSLATWHLAATIPNHYLSESMLTDAQAGYWGRYVDEAPVVEDGHWTVGERPGLGAEIDLDAVEHASADLAYDRLGTR